MGRVNNTNYQLKRLHGNILMKNFRNYILFFFVVINIFFFGFFLQTICPNWGFGGGGAGKPLEYTHSCQMGWFQFDVLYNHNKIINFMN